MLKNTLLLALLVNLAVTIKQTATSTHIQTSIRSGKTPSLGVSLGGWLVAEQWMTASSSIWQGVPENVYEQGEYATMKYLGHAKGDSPFDTHRKTWITESDIKDISQAGLNTVRVPVGYWITGFDKTNGSEWQVFAPGAIKHLDNLIRLWALKYNVAVLISIHAAKGS